MHYRQQASIVTQRTLEVDGITLTGNQPKQYYVSWHVIGRIREDRSHRINTETFCMKEINNSVYREGIGWGVPVFQDGNYALTMDSASLSTRQMVVTLGNYHRFETNFLLPLKWQNFWQLHIRKFHSFFILDLGDGKWQVQRWRPGKVKRFLVRIPGQNFTCLGLARNQLQYMYTPVMPKDYNKLCLKLAGNK